MNELPQIVKFRLNVNGVSDGDPHPDFGVLTAFVEGSLVGNRRTNVLIHLAKCSKCNQLVSLAAPPESEKNVLPEIKHTWSLWTLLPVRRFMVPALGSAAALLVIWAMHAPTPPGPVVHTSPAPTIVASAPSAPSTVTSARERIANTGSSRNATAASIRTRQIRPLAAPGQFDGLGPNAANVTIQTPVAPPLPPVPPAHHSAAAPAVSSVAAPPAGPCWRVSDSGTLQKSSTCGIEWQDISLGSPTTVRVMQSVANNIWVGGNGGALYHSGDGGDHWRKISIPMLTDDITAIAFGTPLEGKLATADGAIWATTDGGQTWHQR